MPQCTQCEYREGTHCRAADLALIELKRPLSPPPTGACTIAIVEQYLSEIRSGMRVLEIGCGSWTKIRDHCVKVGAHYEAIDSQKEYFGVANIATRIENLAELSFASDSFDLVIGNQTMEHWGEHGCSLQRGLYQCFRVTKPGGRVFLNIPIHFHGTREFMLGQVEKLQQLIEPFSHHPHLERWGYPTHPIPEFYPFPGFWTLKNRPAHLLDMRLTKNKPMPLRYNMGRAYSGKLAQIMNYSVSFNLYRVIKKLFPLAQFTLKPNPTPVPA